MKSFWRFLETRVSARAVLAEWRHVAGGDHFHAIESMLMPTDDVAESYPVLNTSLHLPRVIDYGDGTLAAVCSREPDRRIPLIASDIVLYALDLPALRKTLCASLSSVVIAKTPIDPDRPVLHIGNWEPKKAAAFPIYLLRCRTRASLRATIAELATTIAKPGAIVLTPTRATWESGVEEMARAKRLLLVAVDEIVEVRDHVLVQTNAWNEYLEAFCQMVETTLPANFRNKKSRARRASREADIDKLERALEEHIRSARDHAFNLKARGQPIVLLPRPEQKDLAVQLGMSTSAVSRCLHDPRAKVLKILWETADSIEAVLAFKR